MQLNPNLTFPINLGVWELTNGEGVMAASYDQWDWGVNAPYAGGFGVVVFNSGNGSQQFQLSWLAPNSLALQPQDSGRYVWGKGSLYSPVLTLCHGSKYNIQLPNTSPDPNGTFTLYNLLGGFVQILYNGVPLAFLWDNYSWWDWSVQPIEPVAVNNPAWQSFKISGSQFYVLLLTGSGAGLALQNQDLAANGYIFSVAGSDFTSAQLEGALFINLPNQSLAGCTFNNAFMSGAQLAGCTDIGKASWQYVDLTGTDISSIDPTSTRSTNFAGAILTGATLSNGQPLEQNFIYDQSSFAGAYLGGANLKNISFVGCDFTGAHLQGAILDGADLTNAILVNADFTRASLIGTILNGAQLAGAHFDYCDVSYAIFDPTPQFGQSITTRTTFNSARVPAATLGMNWSYVDLTNAIITAMPASLAGLNAQFTLFPSEAVLTSVNLQNANLSNAQMYYADLSGADLGNATLVGTLLKGARLNQTNLSGANMTQAWLIDELSNDPNKYEAAQANGAFLINTILDQSHCDGVDFSGVIFLTDSMLSSQPASAQGATMNRTVFTDANVINVNFRGTQFAGGQFSNTILVCSQFQSTQITPTTDGVGSVPSMSEADIRGTLFADQTHGGITNAANMDGLDMDNATCSTVAGNYVAKLTDYYGKPVLVFEAYPATLLGTTTSATTCPNGSAGPCSLG